MTPAFDKVRFGAPAFREQILKLKAGANVDFQWYLYETMAILSNIAPLITSDYDGLFRRPKRVADIGAADGDLGFYFSSLGFDVDIYDYGPTNMNGLKGARCLKQALPSDARVIEIDLDSQFNLSGQYDLVFFMGLLYHLKNPFYALERLAKHTRYAFISTRIARHFRAGTQDVWDIPAAYLLAPDECNNDATNYWIFTDAGLKRLIERTGWRLISYHVHELPHSNPQDQSLDERAHAFIEARS